MWILGQLFEILLVLTGLALLVAIAGGLGAYFESRKARHARRLRDRVREEAGYSDD